MWIFKLKFCVLYFPFRDTINNDVKTLLISTLTFFYVNVCHSSGKNLSHILKPHFSLLLQYIAANPGVQGAYMPQYLPMQAPPVSL